MYLNHFGLRSLPFEATSNASVYVDLPEQQAASNTVLVGLESGEGFVKVVGEVGTGKTALCRNLLDQLDSQTVAAKSSPPRTGDYFRTRNPIR